METQMTPKGEAQVCPNAPTDAMIAAQWALEESMVMRGFESFHRDIANAKEHGREEQTNYGTVMLLHRLEAMTKGIKGFVAAADTGLPGKRHLAVKPLGILPAETTAYLALRAIIAGLTATRTVQAVAVSIGGMVEDELRLQALRARESKTYTQVVNNAKKRVGYDYKRVYALRIAAQSETGPNWSRIQRLHVGTVLLDIAIQTTRIVEIHTTQTSPKTKMMYVTTTAETDEWIHQRNSSVSMLRPKYEPMIVPPRDWTSAFSGGYLSSHIAPLSLVKTRSREYLQELSSADMPIVYEAINAVQRTAWQINTRVLDVMQTIWDTSSTLAGIPPREGLAFPAKPHDIDTNEEACKLWRIKAAKVRQRNAMGKSARITVSMTLGVAGRYASYEKIYFPCQFDFRGRVYSVTTLSPQGSDTTKSLLRFANGKPLGANGGQWLAYQGANLAGNDKVTLEERVQWVLDNESAILACANDPLGNTAWCGVLGGVKVDKPWQFLAFCFEWSDYCAQGEDFVSHLPVSMDGSCSGIQHFSAMLRDKVGGNAVNLVPADKPQDVYGIVADAVKAQIADDLVNGTEDTLAHNKAGVAFVREGTKTFATQWNAFGVTRKVTKRSVMTLAYGSKEYGFRGQVMEDVLQPAQDAATNANGDTDTAAFPFTEDGYAAAGYMAKAIWEAVTVKLSAATTAMKWLQSASSLAAKENLPVRWTTSVGFPVMQKYMDESCHRVETSIAGKVTKLTMYKDKTTLNGAKMSSGISPNFVHSCDAAHLMLTVVRGSQAGMDSFAVVHDSFGTTAADMNVFFEVVRAAFVEIYEDTNVLDDFRNDVALILTPEVLNELPPTPPQGNLDVSQVTESRYCFA